MREEVARAFTGYGALCEKRLCKRKKMRKLPKYKNKNTPLQKRNTPAVKL